MGKIGKSKVSMEISGSSTVSLLRLRARNQRWLPDVFRQVRGPRAGAYDMRMGEATLGSRKILGYLGEKSKVLS